jgi:hypothetical protein
VSFEDPDEQRTWVFDATYLRSNYMCIYGCGCKGILDEPAPELQQGCCSHGAHFVDDDDIANLVRHAERLTPEQWQFHDTGRSKKGRSKKGKGKKGSKGTAEKGCLAEGEPEADGSPVTTTRVVDGACIFLNRVGFDGGVGCALHIAALEAAERPMDWKPSVCWQVPLRLEHSTDESGHVTSRLREWKRRDWGEGGSEFAWWCTEEPDAFVGSEPLYASAKDEIVELVGEHVYDAMVQQLERPNWVPLPHPAVRR